MCSAMRTAYSVFDLDEQKRVREDEVTREGLAGMEMVKGLILMSL